VDHVRTHFLKNNNREKKEIKGNGAKKGRKNKGGGTYY